MVCCNQNQLWPDGFQLRSATEAGEDSENDNVSGENAETDRRENCETKDEGHKNRIHR